MAAYTLAERGRRVLVLERGPAADPESDPSDGPKMYLGMYGSGRGEVTDRRLRLREAYVVGGATTLGHAVKLAAPTSGGLDWAAASGLDAERFVVSLIQARDLAGVVRSDDRGAQLDPLALGLEKLELEGTYAACEQWEMLTPLLARAQARFPDSSKSLPTAWWKGSNTRKMSRSPFMGNTPVGLRSVSLRPSWWSALARLAPASCCDAAAWADPR